MVEEVVEQVTEEVVEEVVAEDIDIYAVFAQILL